MLNDVGLCGQFHCSPKTTTATTTTTTTTTITTTALDRKVDGEEKIKYSEAECTRCFKESHRTNEKTDNTILLYRV